MFVQKLLYRHQDSKLRMLPGQSSLEVNCIRRLHRTVCRKLNGRALNKGSCGHNHLTVIARHIPGLRVHIGIHRCGSLDSLTKGNHTLRFAQSHSLDDILSWFLSVWNHREAQFFVNVCGKNSSL